MSRVPHGEPGVSSAARPVDLESRVMPSRQFRWGWAPVRDGYPFGEDSMWFKTQRASRSWARNQLGACVLMEYYAS